MTKQNRFSPEVRERAVRLVFERRRDYSSMWGAIESVALGVGCVPQTLREWVRRHEVDSGMRHGVTSKERERIKVQERAARELRRTNKTLKLVAAHFFPAQRVV